MLRGLGWWVVSVGVTGVVQVGGTAVRGRDGGLVGIPGNGGRAIVVGVSVEK